MNRLGSVRTSFQSALANESRLVWILLVASLGILVAGIASGNGLACASALICLALVLHRLISRRTARGRDATAAPVPPTHAAVKPTDRTRLRSGNYSSMPPTTSAAFVREMIFQGRYAVLMRPEVAKNLSSDQRQDVLRAFNEEMSLIKGGRIAKVPKPATEANHAPETIYIDRYAVSNLEFQEFVNAGGYDMPEVWSAEIRDSLGYFVDQTGRPGPRYWRDSNYATGTAHLPVVGICWFEADAYARWVGKRLPESQQWVRAAVGAAPTPSPATQPMRFPWGNMFHEDRANLWISGRGQPVPVEEYALGQTPAGVRQLIGNTWEWMNDDLSGTFPHGELKGPSAKMKAIRGGAFNTYFESQATCQNVSGDHPTARRDNIGFRCSFSAADADPQLLEISQSA